MRVLAVGDSYVAPSVFRRGLAPVAERHELEVIDLDERAALAGEDALSGLHEYLGSPAALLGHMEGVEVLVVHGAPVTDEVLGASAALKLVGCARGGPVNVAVEAASRRGIPVTTTPGKNAAAVAEQTIAFLIMLARRFSRAQRFLQDGARPGRSAFEGSQFFGEELAGRAIGLVGYGNVGSAVAQRARALGMKVTVYDPAVAVGAEDGVTQVATLDNLLGSVEFVSLHARASETGEPLIDGKRLEAMRRGAYFVNTARESLVDEEALDAALASGHLAGAALDVVMPSDDEGVHPLLRHDNVVLTPHIGGATHETLLRGVSMLCDEILRFADGEPMRYVINGAAVEA